MLFNYMSTPQKSFWTLYQLQKYPIRALNQVKINWRNIENKSFSSTWVDPKIVVERYSNLTISPLGPQKDKIDPKIKSNSNVRIRGIIEN